MSRNIVTLWSKEGQLPKHKCPYHSISKRGGVDSYIQLCFHASSDPDVFVHESLYDLKYGCGTDTKGCS